MSCEIRRKKSELLKECAKTLQKPKVIQWSKKNLEGESQAYTIDSLENGVLTNELSIRDALSIALVVGVQWNVKFEDVP